MKLAEFDGPSPKTPHKRKNLPKIFYASRAIAHFVANFVAMATMKGEWNGEEKLRKKGKEKWERKKERGRTGT